MRLALVSEAPRTGRRPDLKYLTETIAAVAAYAGVEVEWREFYAIPEPQVKPPGLMLIREHSAQLFDGLNDWKPDHVVSLGKSALNALADGSLRVLKREHGRTRWLEINEFYEAVAWTPTVAPYSVIKSPDLHRDFVNVIHKAITRVAPMDEMPITLYVAHTADDLRDMLADLEGASVVGVDVETGGLSAYSDELTCVGFGAYGEDPDPYGVAVVVSREILFDPEVIDLMWDATWRLKRRSVGHNFKFDMQFLERFIGWAPDTALIGDTLLLAHLVDERPTRSDSRARGSGLKDLVAQRYDLEYGFAPGFDKPYDDLSDQEVDDLHVYLGKDVCYTARLWHDLSKEAISESPQLLLTHDELLAPAARAIAQCELAGAPIDEAWVHETMDVLRSRIARRSAVLERTLPNLIVTLVVDNILSPTQIADVMYDEWEMTPDIRRRKKLGQDRSTDKDHIEAAVAKYLGTARDREARWLRSLLALRKDTKTLTLYQKSILGKLDDDGRVRASFLLHGTSTGRLSSQGPNLQNVPAVKRVGADQVRPMRRAFRPKTGRVWCDVDYSQLELRVAAGISGDQAMADVFRSGRDVHREIATSIFSKPADKITAAERFLAKSVSFGIIYGRGAKALAGGAEMDYAEREGMKRWDEPTAEAFIRKFLQSYPDLTAWIARMHQEVPSQGYVESPFGRRRRFPLIIDSPAQLSSVQRQAVNTPVQSAASDLCLTALTKIRHVFEVQAELDGTDDGPIVLFPVHDSICIECNEDDVGWVEEVCRSNMEIEWMGVPLEVDFSSGPDWATAGGWRR